MSISMPLNVVLLSTTLGLLTSCATLSRDECRVAKWREIGHSDAAQGYSASRIAEHRSACARVNVSVDLADYNDGYDRGLNVYCQPEAAYRLASQGRPYPSQCSTQRFPLLSPAYSQGVVYYQLQQDRSELHHKRQEKQTQLKALNQQITNNNDKHQAALRSLRADLNQEISRIEQQIKVLDERLIQAQLQRVH